MKRIISTLLAILMLVSCIGAYDLSVYAQSELTGIDFEFAEAYVKGTVTFNRFVREKQGNKLVLHYSDDSVVQYICKYLNGKKAFYSADGSCIDGTDIEFSNETLVVGSNDITITYKGVSTIVTLDCIHNDVTSIEFSFAPDVTITERADGDYYNDIKEQIVQIGNKLTLCYPDDVKKEYNCVYDADAKAPVFIDNDNNELLIKPLSISPTLPEFKVGSNNVVKIYAFDLKFSCDAAITLDHAEKTVKNKRSATCSKEGYTGDTVCSVCNYKFTSGKPIAKKSHSYVTTKATLTANGGIKCKSCSAVKTTYYYPKTIKLSKTSYVYDGKKHKPTVTIKDSKGKVISSDNYTIKYPSGMKKVGEYKVKVTFKGSKYSGTKTLTYSIVPKAVEISSVKGKKQAFSLKWKKNTTQTSGYQLEVSTSSKFKNSTFYAISNNKTTETTVGKLKAKKKYYVRIRTFKTINGVRYYSAWSKAKSVKTK